MFERYSEASRIVVFYARAKATLFPTGYIEPEHLLLALIQHQSELMRQLLPETDFGAMTAALEAGFNNPLGLTIPASAGLPLSSLAKRVLQMAAKEAADLKQRLTEPGHLVLGLLASRTSAATLLAAAGLTPEAVRERLR